MNLKKETNRALVKIWVLILVLSAVIGWQGKMIADLKKELRANDRALYELRKEFELNYLVPWHGSVGG